MMLCVIDGGQCCCQPDEGITCHAADAMKHENAALHKRVTELETAHAQAMGRAEDLDREAQRYADIANSVNKSWHCRKCGAAIPADMVEQNVEHVCEGPDSGASDTALLNWLEQQWPVTNIDVYLEGDASLGLSFDDGRREGKIRADNLRDLLLHLRAHFNGTAAEAPERVNGPSTPENNPNHHQRSATINDPANPGIVKGNDGPQF